MIKYGYNVINIILIDNLDNIKKSKLHTLYRYSEGNDYMDPNLSVLSINIDVFDFDEFKTYQNIFELYKTKNGKLLLSNLFNDLCKIDIENTPNIQKYEGYLLLCEYLTQIEEFNLLKTQKEFNI